MPVIFYPNEEDVELGSVAEKLEILMEAATRYKAAILDPSNITTGMDSETKKRSVPRELQAAYNWQEIAKILREIRELPEGNAASKTVKANHLNKLADIYEVLRGAKMPKLEAVRIALMNEAKQLRGG